MEQRADNGETPPFAIQPMKTRTIKYAVYCRNMPFWVTRHQRGEEIQLTRVGRFVGFLHTFPKCAGLKPLQPQEVSADADRRFRASALPKRSSRPRRVDDGWAIYRSEERRVGQECGVRWRRIQSK